MQQAWRIANTTICQMFRMASTKFSYKCSQMMASIFHPFVNFMNGMWSSPNTFADCHTSFNGKCECLPFPIQWRMANVQLISQSPGFLISSWMTQLLNRISVDSAGTFGSCIFRIRLRVKSMEYKVYTRLWRISFCRDYGKCFVWHIWSCCSEWYCWH